MPTIWHLIVWHVLHCMKFRQKNPPELSSLSKNFQFAPYCPLSFQHHVPSCGHFCVFYRCFSQLCWKSLLTRVCGTWTGLASETCQFWCRWCRIATWGHSIDARVNSHQPNLPTFFLFFFCCWEKTPRIWSCWQKWKRKLAKSPTPNPCFFFEFWICLPKNESFHVFLLTSGWALLLYSRRPRSPMHMQGSSARAVGFRSNERIWFLTIGPKERKPSAVMLRALRMPPGEEFFHFSVSFQEFWTSVGKKFHKVLSRKAWKDCKTLFILAFLRFFPSMMGP